MGDSARMPLVICLSEMLGCPVINARDGARLGRVSDVVVDLTSHQVIGFRLRHGGLLDRRWRIAALQDLTMVGPDAVVLPDDLALREDDNLGDRLSSGRRMAVVDRKGAEVGRLADVAADLVTGELVDLIVVPAGGTARRREPPVVVPVHQASRFRPSTILLDGAALTSLRGGAPAAVGAE